MTVPPLPPHGSTGSFLEAYTKGLTTTDLERLFTEDTPEAYRFFSRGIDREALRKLRWHRRLAAHVRLVFLGFTLKLTPARRALYGLALACTLIGLAELFRGVHWLLVPHPVFVPGTSWLLVGFALVNLLVLLEVADRLSLKNDLEIARGIQQAMLPTEAHHTEGAEAFGLTRPANTVGGDFYDIRTLADGRLLLALGDVAGKGSPAALLMALLLAIMRTLVDQGLDGAALVTQLNIQMARHAPRSRFVTLFVATLDPASGDCSYVNAGQTPPLVRRVSGAYDRLTEGGMALGMFEHATYAAGRISLAPGDVIVMYSDGVSEAEDRSERPLEEAGVRATVDRGDWGSARELAWSLVSAVERHVEHRRLLDDLTVVVARRLPLLPRLDATETPIVPT